jgi:hypothetical protein
LFNHIFGDKAFSWKSFRRVFAYTFIAGTVIYSFSLLATDFIFNGFKSDPDTPLFKFENLKYFWEDFPRLLKILFICSLPIDYFAVLKTRFFLSIASRRDKSFWILMFFLVADLLVTYGLVAALIFRAEFFLAGNFWAKIFLMPSDITSIFMPIFHSLWLIMYVISVITTRFLLLLSRKTVVFRKIISQRRIEEEPFLLIGECASVFIIIGFVVGGL